MRLYPRRKANGERVWWASWTEGGATVRRSTRCSTKPAAELVVARWERERADPIFAAANEATLGGEYLMFIAECKADKLAEGTLTMYRQKAANVIDVLGKDTRLANIDSTHVADYIALRRAEGATESTIYKEWVTLRGILKSARHRDRYHRDPAALKPPRLSPEYTPRTRYLTPCEVVALLDALPRHHRAIVAFTIATGARRAEWRRAQLADIARDYSEVRLRGSKTKASARTIPIPAPFRPLLQTALESMAPPWPAWNNARRDILAACVRAGIQPATWNDLRRTFASLLFQLGVAPHVIARLLGHTTTAMVDRVYSKHSAESLSALLDIQLGGPRT